MAATSPQKDDPFSHESGLRDELDDRLMVWTIKQSHRDMTTDQFADEYEAERARLKKELLEREASGSQ